MGLTFVQGGERLPTVVAGGEMDSHGADLGRNRTPDGEGKGGRGEERRGKARSRSEEALRTALLRSPVEEDLALEASPPSLSPRRLLCSERERGIPFPKSMESWIALPGKRVERPGSIRPVDNQTATMGFLGSNGPLGNVASKRALSTEKP
jgi:hypothetical protein